jgi:cytochrome c
MADQQHLPSGTPPGPKRFIVLTIVALAIAIGLYVLLLGGFGGQTDMSDEQANVRAGQTIAEVNCAACHAVGMTGESPNGAAPPFRTFHTMWPVEHLEEALAEGILVAHAEGMPEFQFDPDQIGQFIAYLKSLEQ